MVLDIRAKIPLNLSLNTRKTLVANKSATVTAAPLGSVKFRVVPFKVSVTGSVVVASAGIAFSM